MERIVGEYTSGETETEIELKSSEDTIFKSIFNVEALVSDL